MPTKRSAISSCRRRRDAVRRRAPAARSRDVDALGLELRSGLRLRELLLAGGERLRHAAAGLTDELAERGLLLVRTFRSCAFSWASGDASPAWAARAAFSSAVEDAASIAETASATAASTLLG
jgi:hypothetical protein